MIILKIKLGILANDTIYLNRLAAFITSRHNENFEISSFTDNEVALKTIQLKKIDIMLVEEICNINVAEFLHMTYIIYLTNSRDKEIINECPAIFKYQKTELIIKNIWNFYSEVLENVKKTNKHTDINCKIFAFATPCGGSGSSTLAVACALYFAKHGKNVMYLNLEKMSASDIFFCEDGTQTLSDMIFALKSKKINLSLKMEACIKHDAHNVSFFSQTNQVLDMYELTVEEQLELINVIAESGLFDILVLDLDFDLNAEQKSIHMLADKFIITSTGSEVNNKKISSVYSSLVIQEQNTNISLLEHIVLLYNKFTNVVGNNSYNVALSVIGTIPIINNISSLQVSEQISMYDFWKNLLL